MKKTYSVLHIKWNAKALETNDNSLATSLFVTPAEASIIDLLIKVSVNRPTLGMRISKKNF